MGIFRVLLVQKLLKNMGYNPVEVRAVTLAMLNGREEIAKRILNGDVAEEQVRQLIKEMEQ